MVIIPTAHHVTLSYGYTPVDWIGFLLTLAGVAGVVWLARLRPVSYPRPRHLGGSVPDRRTVLTTSHLAEPYRRLEHELGDAYPAGLGADDIDLWLGPAGGLDIARYAGAHDDGSSAGNGAPTRPEGAPEDAGGHGGTTGGDTREN
jgi:hypothetical protein